MDNLDSPWRSRVAPQGRYRGHCVIPPHFLNEGMFNIEYLICTSPTTTEYVTYPEAVTFYVIDDMENQGVGANGDVNGLRLSCGPGYNGHISDRRPC